MSETSAKIDSLIDLLLESMNAILSEPFAEGGALMVVPEDEEEVVVGATTAPAAPASFGGFVAFDFDAAPVFFAAPPSIYDDDDDDVESLPPLDGDGDLCLGDLLGFDDDDEEEEDDLCLDGPLGFDDDEEEEEDLCLDGLLGFDDDEDDLCLGVYPEYCEQFVDCDPFSYNPDIYDDPSDLEFNNICDDHLWEDNLVEFLWDDDTDAIPPFMDTVELDMSWALVDIAKYRRFDEDVDLCLYPDYCEQFVDCDPFSYYPYQSYDDPSDLEFNNIRDYHLCEDNLVEFLLDDDTIPPFMDTIELVEFAWARKKIEDRRDYYDFDDEEETIPPSSIPTSSIPTSSTPEETILPFSIPPPSEETIPTVEWGKMGFKALGCTLNMMFQAL